MRITSRDVGPITGIFIGAASHLQGRHGCGVIGFTQDSRDRRPALYRPPAPRDPPEGHVAGWFPVPKRLGPQCFVSTASLQDIVGIFVRRCDDGLGNGGRCVGLAIHYDGDDRLPSIQALGQWDPSDQANISRVYELAQDGVLMRLRFHAAREFYDEYSSCQIRWIIKNVTVGVARGNPCDYEDPEEEVDTSPTTTFDCHRPLYVSRPQKPPGIQIRSLIQGSSIYSGLRGGPTGAPTRCVLIKTGPDCL